MKNPWEQQSPIEGIQKIIVIGSGKGGVGKSTVSVNLAMALKNKGYRVGLLDADLYGPSLPRLMGLLDQDPPEIDPQNKILPLIRHGLKLMSMGLLIKEDSAVIWRGPMLFKAIDQFLKDVNWGSLDYLLIDLPPGTGDITLSIAQKVPVNGALVVCTPQNLALIDAKKAIDMFQKIHVPVIGIIENMSTFTPPGQTQAIELFPKGTLNVFLEAKKIPKLAELPFMTSTALSCEAGIPAVESDVETAKVFATLAQKVLSTNP